MNLVPADNNTERIGVTLMKAKVGRREQQRFTSFVSFNFIFIAYFIIRPFHFELTLPVS